MPLTRFKVQTEEVQKDKLALFVFLFALLSTFIQASLIFTSSAKLPPVIPLFYSRTWGEAMLAPKILIWILPAICASVTITNYSLAVLGLRGRKFLEKVLFIFTLILAVGTLYGTIKIIALLV